MTLAEGETLGPYQIQRLLGKGAMGEVYAALDPRLGRRVAVKVIADPYSSNEERMRRFEQEAQAAASLNHPNILAIYDVGREAGRSYIVSELLEGQTLRERLEKGPLPVREVLDLGEQIAEALSAAHEKGIIHRDLKPENLFVQNGDRIKILDFGLAKLSPLQGSNSHLQTIGLQTAEGVILGTAGYMSPEQVRGLPADARSDLFSLGAILYEMLLGVRAFAAQSAVETMNSILHSEPGDFPPSIPAGLQRLIRHCLEKMPQRRFQSARDLAFSLQGVPEGSGRTVATAAAAVYHRVTFRRGLIWSARFTQDGSGIVYGASWEGKECRLFLARKEGTESLPLSLPPADILSISSAGEMAILLNRHYDVGYCSSGTLARAAIMGGASREIVDNVQEAEWLPGGKNLMAVRSIQSRYSIEFPIGQTIYRTLGWISHARVSPDGSRVAYFEHPLYGDDSGYLCVVDSIGQSRRLSEAMSTAQGLAWNGNDEIWYTGAATTSLDRQLLAARLSGSTRVVLGMPASLTLHDISQAGEVLLAHENFRREAVVELEDGKQKNISWLNWSFPRDISRDGKSLYFLEQAGPPGDNAILLRNIDGSPPVHLDDGLGLGFTNDEKFIMRLQLPEPKKVLILPVGVGEQKSLDNDGIDFYWAAPLPDNERLVLYGVEEGKSPRLYLQRIAGGKPERFSDEDVMIPNFFNRQAISPKGDAIVGWNRSSFLTIYPLDGGPSYPIPGTAGEMMAAWSKDAKHVFTYLPNRLPGEIYCVDAATGARELWKTIEPPEPAGITGLAPILFSSDRKVCVYSYRRIVSDLYIATGLM